MSENETQENKPGLERVIVQDLQLFLFYSQSPTKKSSVIDVIAYSLEEAQEIVKSILTEPGSVFLLSHTRTARYVLEKIQEFMPDEQSFEQAKVKMSKEHFLASLILVSDDYVNPDDRKELKEIINRIQV